METQDLFPIDLRSDTVTRPSPAMRRAMADAEVGDDVFGDDPTVNHLQERVAALLGKEAALYVASGTMGNEVAVRALTEPGDEIILHRDSHVYVYEGGAPALLSGCSFHLLDGARGLFTDADVHAAVRADDEHMPRSRLVVIENTQNRGGGAIWPLAQVAAVERAARAHDLRVHLDGARLMNACVASGHAPADYARHADTVSICFSKGLGAPIGSALAGTREVIYRARRARKVFGGGMRQVGILAAAALFALDHNVDRLAEDHANARRLAEALAALPGITLDPATVETNIVYFDLDPAIGAERFCRTLHEAGVWMLSVSANRVRAVAHLDVSRAGIEKAIEIVGRTLAGRR